MELRREESDGEVALPGTWQGPFCSGAPAIFASVAARLGARVRLAGAVGEDAFGRFLRERLQRDGVDGAVLTRPPAARRRSPWSPTTAAAGATSSSRSAARRPRRSTPRPRRARRARRAGSTCRDRASASAIRSPPPSRQTVAAGLRAGARLSLDPNLRPDSPPEARERTARLARRASLVFPSPGELAALGLTTPSSSTTGRSCARPTGRRAWRSTGTGRRRARDGAGAGRRTRWTRPVRATRSPPRSSRRSRTGCRSGPRGDDRLRRGGPQRHGARRDGGGGQRAALRAELAPGGSASEGEEAGGDARHERRAAGRRLLDGRPLDRPQASPP